MQNLLRNDQTWWKPRNLPYGIPGNPFEADIFRPGILHEYFDGNQYNWCRYRGISNGYLFDDKPDKGWPGAPPSAETRIAGVFQNQTNFL